MIDLSIAIDQFWRSDWFVSCWVSWALAFSSRQTSCSRAAMYFPMDGSTPRRLFRADFCSSLSTFIGFAQLQTTFLPTLTSVRGVLIRRQTNGGGIIPRSHLCQTWGSDPTEGGNDQKLSWPASHNSCQERGADEFNARKHVVKMAPVVRPTPITISAVSAWLWVNGRSSINRRLAIEWILLLTFCT